MTPNQPLRTSNGLDASGKRLVNLGYADKANGGDGVNVNFFVYENTIQQYDPNRSYPIGFAVIYQNRVYTSKSAIAAGAWDRTKWKVTRTDPEWRIVTSTAALEGAVSSGEYIASNVKASDAVYTLPNDPANNTPTVGDTIVIRDEAGVLHDYGIVVNGNGYPIFANQIGSASTYRITVPFSTTMFVFNGSRWTAQLVSGYDFNRKLVSNASYIAGDTFYRASVSEHVIRETQFGGGLRIRLPKYANHGDVISTYDVDRMNAVTKTEYLVHPDSGHKILMAYGETSATSFTKDGIGWGFFTFDTRIQTWRYFDGDVTKRWKELTSNYVATVGEKLYLTNTDPLVPITIMFPSEASEGDTFIIDTSYLRNGTSVTLQVPASATTAWLVPDDQTLVSPRVSNYRSMLANQELYLTKTETIVTNNRCTQWEWAFKHRGVYNAWILVDTTEIPFRVDRNDTSFHAMAAIATQAEVNKNKEDITTGQNRDCEAFVTPETLANKTATTTRRGIARIATDSESKAISGSTEAWNLTIITPETLNNRLTTPTMRGVAATATQAEVNAQTGSGEAWSQKIVTPETLNGRKATETMTGITQQVLAGGTAQTARGTAGTGIHNFADHYRYVTSKTLFEKVASVTSQGMVFLADQTEANTGAANHVNGPLVISAATLQGRQATTTLTGLSRAATDAEVLLNTPALGMNVHVTMDSLVKRTATETRFGFAETATQSEVDAGVLHDQYFVSPLTFKTWLSGNRLSVVAASGLTTSGNIWAGQSFDIVGATTTQRGTLRVATQVEANDMVTPLDTVVITPSKLNARNATETQTGLIEIATQSEVDTGADTSRSVVPATLISTVRSGTGYRMQEGRYGVGVMSTLVNGAAADAVFQGDDLLGSTRAIASYAHTDTVVSPRGLNTALSYYLPKMATAQAALNLELGDGTKVVASDWIRRTIAQSVTGAMTFETGTRMNAGLSVYTDASHLSLYETDQSNKKWVFEVQGGLIKINEDTTTRFSIAPTTGIATFTNQVLNGGVDPTANDHLTRWAYTEGRYMRKTGTLAETITGVKTFTSNMVLNAGAGVGVKLTIGGGVGGINTDTSNNIALGSSGTMYLRPNGVASTTNQTTIDTAGNLTASGQVRALASAPLVASDLTRKDYVDGLIDDALDISGQRVNKLGDSMTGTLTINAAKALAANGDVDVDGQLSAKKLRIDVGNGEYLEIRANPETKSVDFVWIS